VSLRKLFWIGLLVVAGYMVVTFIDVWVASVRQSNETAPAAVVLGAAQYNGEPSDALRGRLDAAAELYGAGRVELIVVTGGGQAEDVTTEAKTGYDYLRQTAGVPDGDLRLEVQGSSTYESLAAASRFLRAEGIDKVLVVTDPYHSRRSQLIAEEVGLDASSYSTGGASSLDRLVRETLGVAVGRIIGFRRLDNVFNQ
jgi:vancomycin permeability regulator SanA